MLLESSLFTLVEVKRISNIDFELGNYRNVDKILLPIPLLYFQEKEHIVLEKILKMEMGHLNNLSKFILLGKMHSFGNFWLANWEKKPIIWIGNNSGKWSLFDKTKNHCLGLTLVPFRRLQLRYSVGGWTT